MTRRLHITNGDSATPGIAAADPSGDVVAWRDILHEGPVPAGLSLRDTSAVRARFLADEEFGNIDEITRSFAERDDLLSRFTDYDEVTLWFEWDLYDQLQLIQILDFLADHTADELAETRTTLSIVETDDYLGPMAGERFPGLFDERKPITPEMLSAGRTAWTAFRSDDPRSLAVLANETHGALQFLPGALTRFLEEFPSTTNGLSRSERQILEAVSQGPRSFTEIFKQTSAREERIYCGDTAVAGYIERMSQHVFPLLVHPTGESIDAPRRDGESRAFRNSEIALTETGREVLSDDRDWIELGGTDRWLGGVHLEGGRVRWRWDPRTRRLVDTEELA
jgi:hypothetical protein